MNGAAREPDTNEVTILLAEYKAAQEMLRHYDTLNWQIGAILIAATTAFTAVLLQEKVIELIRVPLSASNLKSLVPLAVPAISWLILQMWVGWFDRHRHLYNFRNETMHRIELRLGMYHHLLVLEAAKKADGEGLSPEHEKARERVRQYFTPQMEQPTSLGTPGHKLAHHIPLLIPIAQLLLYFVIKVTN